MKSTRDFPLTVEQRTEIIFALDQRKEYLEKRMEKTKELGVSPEYELEGLRIIALAREVLW